MRKTPCASGPEGQPEMLLNTGTRWIWLENPQKNDVKQGLCACVM